MVNQSIVMAAQRLLAAFYALNVKAIEREAGLIAQMFVEDQRRTSSEEFPVSFDGWDLIVVGEYNDSGDFDLEAVYLPDSAVEATDLFDARELELFMKTRAEAEAKQIADEMAHERELSQKHWDGRLSA